MASPPPPHRHSHQSPSSRQSPLGIVSKETLANFTHTNNRSLYIAPYNDDKPRGRSPSPFRGRFPSASPLRTFGGRLRSKSLSLIRRGSRPPVVDTDKPLPPLPTLGAATYDTTVTPVALAPSPHTPNETAGHRHVSEFGTSASSTSAQASDLFGSFLGKLDDAIATGLANPYARDMSTIGSRVADGGMSRSARRNGEDVGAEDEHGADETTARAPTISLPVTRGLELRKRKRSPDEEAALPAAIPRPDLTPAPETQSRAAISSSHSSARDDQELTSYTSPPAPPAAYASSPTIPSTHDRDSSPIKLAALEHNASSIKPTTSGPTPSPPSARPRDPRRHASIYSGAHEWREAAEDPRSMSFVGSYEWLERDGRWDLVRPFIKKRRVGDKE